MTATNPSRFELPRPLGSVLARLPAYPGSFLLVKALNLTLARTLPADVGSLLLNKKMRIQVRDAQVAFDFVWTGLRFVATKRVPQTDLTISANAHDFYLMSQRQVDPDTLFFSRRLLMEGDTELGLIVKNALDALELPVFAPQQWTPPQLLSRLAALRPGVRP